MPTVDSTVVVTGEVCTVKLFELRIIVRRLVSKNNL
jgi:hypothetical protein